MAILSKLTTVVDWLVLLDHSTKSAINFNIEKDVDPWINGSVSLTGSVSKVNSSRMQCYFCLHHEVHVGHLEGQPTNRKNHHNNDKCSKHLFWESDHLQCFGKSCSDQDFMESHFC